jgi:putative phosphoribosyl transferase
VRFVDRREAGRLLADRLGSLPPDAVVLGLPRGGVIVAAGIAAANGLPLGVLVVRKLGAPKQPEFAVGAIGEGGTRLLDERALASTRTTAEQLAAVEDAERAELARRVQRYRGGAPPPDLAGRTYFIL